MPLTKQVLHHLFRNHSVKLSIVLPKYSTSYREGLNVSELKNGDEGIVVFALNRPKQKNAFSVNLVQQLDDALDNISLANSKVLIIRSAVPGVFGAGADLKERVSFTPKQVSEFVQTLRMVFARVANVSIPVIAAIDGVALGGGLELALACDIRVTATNAKLGLVEAKLGIIPGAGGTQRLPRIIGPALAKELMYTCRVVNGTEAAKLGLVNQAVEQNASGDAAYVKSVEIAREILPNAPVAVKMVKAAVNRGLEMDITSGLAMEGACYAQVIPTKDRLEGLAAFSEKRKPNFIGE